MNVWRSIIPIGPGKRTTCLLLEIDLEYNLKYFFWLHTWLFLGLQNGCDSMVANEESCDQVERHAQITPPKKGHSEANGMDGNHQQQGKGVLGGETLKPSQAAQKSHMEHPGHLEHPSFLEHPDDQKKIKLGVPMVQLVRSLVVLNDHYIGHGAPRKTKVSTFGD